MKDWELFEVVLKKPLQDIIDLATGNWKKGSLIKIFYSKH